MDHHFRFTRLWVDLDITGGPLGSGYEIHSDAGKISVVLLEEPSPFESAQESFQRLLDEYRTVHPPQAELF